jgi:hypothetical protein
MALKNILAENLLDPVRGRYTPGDFYYARDTKALWWVAEDGVLCPLSELLSSCNRDEIKNLRERIEAIESRLTGFARPLDVAGDAELRAAVEKLRARNAAWHAAWLMALEKNSTRRHPGLKTTIDAVLAKLKTEADSQ